MNRFAPRLSIDKLKTLCCLIFALYIALTSGCQIAPKDKPKWPWSKDKSKPLPERMLPVWTDSVLHQPNQPGVRGFGGRIYFYEKDNTDPIEIDGSLAVYVFDADDISLNSQKPLRKFVFTADQFNEHMSKTSIGPSYSIWLPWGEIGGPPRRLSLIARFEGRNGGTTISDPTIKLLPGVPEKDQSDEVAENSKSADKTPFRLSSHQKKRDSKVRQDEESADQEQESKNEIKTIDLPPNFQRHLRGGSTENTKPNEVKATSASDSQTNAHSTQSEANPEDAQLAEGDSLTVAAPVTTQVYDYRTRRSQGNSAFGSAKNDIREGRWINSIARDQHK